ncbi:MAG: hypothetical protein ACOC5R_00555 [Elusimicrobiota bacterium]
MNIKNNDGIALIGSIFLMLILVVLGRAMISLTRREANQEVRDRLKENALYIADAGIEKAIYRIRNSDDTCFTTSVGGATGEVEGEAEVDINSSDSQGYLIESTGYVPSTSSYRSKRKIKSEVYIHSGTTIAYSEGNVVRAGGDVTMEDDITLKGGVWGNGVITVPDGATIDESSSGAGDGNLTSAYNGPGDGVIFDGTADMLGTDPQIKANTTVSGEENVSGSPTVTENAGLDPIPDESFPEFDLESFTSDGDVTRYAGYTGQSLDLTAYYRNTIIFDSPVKLEEVDINGPGTIIVDGGSGSTGIKVEGGLGSADDYTEVNLCVTDNVTVSGEDVKLEDDCYINGAIVGDVFVKMEDNLYLKGIIDCAGDVKIENNMNIEYAAPGWSLPAEGDSSGAVEIITWEEVSAD